MGKGSGLASAKWPVKEDGMVTLKDVSRDVGVSITQVSRALAGYPDVNAETRERIVEAAQRLGYRPNALARGLKTGRSGIIAMVVPGGWAAEESTILFEIVMGLSAEISGLGLRFVLHVAGPEEDVVGVHEDLVRSGGIDGFVMIQPVRNDRRIAKLSKLKVPFVVHGQDPRKSHPYVDIDNFEVGRRMTEHLVSAGHSRILFLNGPKDAEFVKARTEGYRTGLEAAGLSFDASMVEYGPMIEARGEAVTRKALRRPDRPTAIIAGNMMIARGIYRAAGAMGFAIPADLSVLGHDDGIQNFAPDSFSPALGGTSAPLRNAWRALAESLKAQVEKGLEANSPEILEVEFEPNKSVSKIQA